MCTASNFLASRMKNISASPTLAMTKKALELRARGEAVIMLAAGEPDFDTPEHVREAAVAAMMRGETRYTAVDGTPQLKKAVCGKFLRENGLKYDTAQISIGAGGKQVISNALLATVGVGDEVIIPAPYWVSYPDMVQLCEGTPVIVKTSAESGYNLKAEDLAAAITSNTKWLILNSPSNPTGSVLNAYELRRIADVLLDNPHVSVLSDDIYEHLVYDGARFQNIVEIEPELYERTLVVNGVSKAYNMTGWRIGFGAGPAALVKKMAEIQGHLTSNPCSISQAAAVAALDGPQEFMTKQRAVFSERRDIVVSKLNQIPGISCPVPQGAFYVYPSCSGLIGARTPDGKELLSDEDVCTYFLESEKVAVVHGAAFGFSPCFRISYAASTEDLEDACARISRAVLRLKLKN